jgi:hypothetical protein
LTKEPSQPIVIIEIEEAVNTGWDIPLDVPSAAAVHVTTAEPTTQNQQDDEKSHSLRGNKPSRFQEGVRIAQLDHGSFFAETAWSYGLNNYVIRGISFFG